MTTQAQCLQEAHDETVREIGELRNRVRDLRDALQSAHMKLVWADSQADVAAARKGIADAILEDNKHYQ